jgi:heme/copper-type cytochrome/quinol oxidase subunit 2
MQISKVRLHYNIAFIFALIAGLSLMSVDGASAQRLVEPESESVISPTFEQDHKTFNLFTTELPEVREGTLGITGDVYSLPSLIANTGDNVTIHFFNTDVDTVDKHTFTIDSRYNINEEVMNGQQITISFIANQTGIFKYSCANFPKTMNGELVVLP